jgi:hypothetical protein
VITTPWFGALYEMIIGREVSGGFWGPSNPEYVDGFVMAFIFIPTLLLTVFEKSYRQILIVLGIVLLVDITLGAWWSGLVFDLGLALVAWILGQGVLLVRKMIK